MAMKCLLAQFNPTVGDLEGNVRRIQECYFAGVELGVDLVICPELAVTGYPPRDLLLKPHFVDRNLALLEDLAKQTGSVGLVIGFVARNVSGVGRPLHNAVALLHEGAIKATRFKTLLPTYDVFEEDRYFEPSSENTPVAFKGHKLGLTICEDAWNHPLAGQDVLYGRRPLETLKQQGATHLINIAASPPPEDAAASLLLLFLLLLLSMLLMLYRLDKNCSARVCKRNRPSADTESVISNVRLRLSV